ncbi:MAG: PP2C family protein-serine/threonine phosphatase [Blastocatellales bacterium]
MDAAFINILRQEFLFIVLGTVIFAIGLSSLTVFVMRLNFMDKLVLWLGLLAGLYGIRLLLEQQTVIWVFGLTRHSAHLIISPITYLILVPALLFFGELYGNGWKNSFRWLVRAATLYAVLGILSDLVRRQLYSLTDPATLFAIPMLFVAGSGFFFGYQPPRTFREIRPAWIGFLLFLAFVIHEHFSAAGILPWRLRIEPLGFLIFTCCLGYVAARRFLANEQKIVVIDTEMNSARQIQAAILPAQTPRLSDLTVAVRYEPMTSVAGDFYDFLIVDDKRIGLLVADVTGHGVPAALIASMVKVGITAQVSRASDPASVVSGLNDVLCQTLRGQMVTAGYLFIDLEAKTALYSGAGHPPMIIFHRNSRTLREVEHNGLPLGFMPEAEYSNVELALQPGDRILLYSDGLTEAANLLDEQFGDSRLRYCLDNHAHLPADDFANVLLREVSAWSARNGVKTPTDDLTLIVADI